MTIPKMTNLRNKTTLKNKNLETGNYEKVEPEKKI